MNRYIIAVIWKTCDQLWNPKFAKPEIRLIFTNQFYLYIFGDKRIRFMNESTSI